jgi:hypothetical protein
MDLYIPPVVAVIGGVAIVGICFAFRIPIFILGVLSLVLLVYTVVLSLDMFKNEYENMNILQSIGSIIRFIPTNNLASILIITVVIILALGYIINLFGIKALFTNASMKVSNMFNYTGKSAYLTPNSQSANYSIDRSMDRSANQYNTTAYKSAFNRAL